MDNFYFLNLDIPLFKEGVSYQDLPKDHISKIDHKKYFNKEIFNFFEKLNLEIVFVETFFKYPGNKGYIHTDALGGDYVKLNWVFGGGDSEMTWYSPKPGIKKTLSFTATKTPYLSYTENEVEEIARTQIKNPTLVQVGVPHNVVNVTEERFCVSVVFKNNKRPNMSEAVEIFKEYIWQ